MDAMEASSFQAKMPMETQVTLLALVVSGDIGTSYDCLNLRAAGPLDEVGEALKVLGKRPHWTADP